MATQAPPMFTETPSQDESIFYQLDEYPWDSDPEFQSGLQAILGPDPSPSQAEHLTMRARCFYFSRKNNIPLDFHAYQTWRTRHSSGAPSLTNGSASDLSDRTPKPSTVSLSPEQSHPGATDGSEPPAPYPTSFSQIVELITNGSPIPGIKEVPDTVLEGQASSQITGKRRKPWERDVVVGGQERSAAVDAS